MERFNFKSFKSPTGLYVFTHWSPFSVWSLETAGPAYIKLSQWASTRLDIFPPSLCQALARLQRGSAPHSWHHTRQGPTDQWESLTELLTNQRPPNTSLTWLSIDVDPWLEVGAWGGVWPELGERVEAGERGGGGQWVLCPGLQGSSHWRHSGIGLYLLSRL